MGTAKKTATKTAPKTAPRTAVVTGATSGLGEAAAKALAEAGWKVLLVGRDRERGEQVAKETGGELLLGDLMSLADVARLGAEIRAKAPKLDLLVNNAGGTFGDKQLTVDGLERTFALNVAAPFALTEELAEELAAAGGRVVNIVTGLSKGTKASVEELDGPKSKAGMGSYAKNKLALMAVTAEQQRRFGPRGITAVCLHPGIVPSTRFGQDWPAIMRTMGPLVAKLFGMSSSLDDVAARYVKVCTGEVEPGGFYSEGVLSPPPKAALDPEFQRALTAHLEGLVAAPREARSQVASAR